MANLENVATSSFDYTFLSRDINGNALPSNDIFYGPWEGLADDQIITALKLKLGTSIPNGATIAKKNGTDITEYYTINEVLYPKNGNSALNNDLRIVFAYLVSDETDPSKIVVPNITSANSYLDLVNRFASSLWTMTLTDNIDYDHYVLWISYGIFKVNRNGTYTLKTLAGTDSASPTWSAPYMTGGGGVTSSTMIANDIYRSSLSNYQVTIPKDINGNISNRALKRTSYTVMQIFHNGDSVQTTNVAMRIQDDFNPIYDKDNQYGFNVKWEFTTVEVGSSDIPVLAYWLEWADTPSEYTGDTRLDYTKSVVSDPLLNQLDLDTFYNVLFVTEYNGTLLPNIQYIRIIDREYSYKLVVSPGVLNIPTTNFVPSITCTANKLYWDGHVQTYIKDTENRHYFRLTFVNGGLTRELWSVDRTSLSDLPYATNEGSYIFTDNELDNFLAGGDNVNDNVVVEILSEDFKQEDIQTIPIFYQANLRTQSYSYYDADIIGENVIISLALIGLAWLANSAQAQQLKNATIASLSVQFKGLRLSNDQFRIISVTDVSDHAPTETAEFVLLDDNNNVVADGYSESSDIAVNTLCPKKFYCKKVFGTTSVAIKFEYVDIASDDTLTLFSFDADVIQGELSQKINVIEGNEFYDLKIFPSQIRLNHEGSYVNGNIALVIVDKYVDNTQTRISDLSNYLVELNLYSNSNTTTAIVSQTYNTWTNGALIELPDLSNYIGENADDVADYAVLSLYDIANGVANKKYLTSEDCDVLVVPKDGTSPYTLLIQSTVIIDDDSTLETIKNTSAFVPILKLDNQEQSVYSILIQDLKFYDEFDVELSDPLFELHQENNQYYLLPVSDNVQHDDDYAPFDDLVYYGTITYVACTLENNGNEVTIVDTFATCTLLVRVLDFSAGQGYKLNISPAVLYKDVIGELVTDRNTLILFTAIESVGKNHEQVTIDGTNIKLNVKFILQSSNKTITLDVANNNTIDFSNNTTQYNIIGTLTTSTLKSLCNNSTAISCELLVNNLALDVEPISFSYQGLTGNSSSSNYTIDTNNDYVVVDDDTSNIDLKAITTTDISLYKGIEAIDFVNNDIQLEENDFVISLSDNLRPFFQICYELNGSTQQVDNSTTAIIPNYYLRWKTGVAHLEVSGTVTIYMRFVDDLFGQVEVSRILKIIVKDISDGSVYKLLVSPNAVLFNSTGTLSSYSVLSVDLLRIKDGNVTIIDPGDYGIDILFVGYKLNNSNPIPLNLSVSASGQGRYDINENGLYQYSALDIKAVINNIIIDVETVALIKNGEDGDGIEYIYYLSDTINPLWKADITQGSTYGYVLEGNKYYIRQLSAVSTIDDFLPINKSTGININQLINKADFNSSLSVYDHWSDNFLEPTNDKRYLYCALRKYNGKLSGWKYFERPILLTHFATSSILLTLDNDVVILDDNANNNIIRLASLVKFTLLDGANQLSDFTIDIEENEYFDLVKPLNSNNQEDSSSTYYIQLKNGKTLSVDNPYHIVRYFAKVNNSVVAEASQKIKVVNVSADGSSYKLLISNDILYRRKNGQQIEAGFDDNIDILVEKITGDLSEVSYLELNTDSSRIFVVCLVVSKEGEEEIIMPVRSSSTTMRIYANTQLDKLNQNNTKAIYIEAYAILGEYDVVLIDRELISFSVVGDDGANNKFVSLSNDTIVIDDNSTSEIIQAASLGYFEVFEGNTKLTYGSQLSEQQYSVNSLFNNNDINDILQISARSYNNNYQFDVTRKSTSENVRIPEGVYLITHTITFKDNTTITKYLKLKVVDISEDGTTYKLDVIPDTISTSKSKVVLENQTITISPLKLSPHGDNTMPTYNIIVNDNNNVKIASVKNNNCLLTLNTNTSLNYNYLIAELYISKGQDDVLVDRETISIIKEGNDGAKGDTGAMIRTFYESGGHPKAGFEYEDGSGDYLDYVIFDLHDMSEIEGTNASVYPVFKCIQNIEYESFPSAIASWYDIFMADSSSELNDYYPPNWQLINSNSDAFITNLIAVNARIEKLSTADLNIYDQNNVIIGLFTSKYGDSDHNGYPLWLGGTKDFPNFSVDINGNVTCKNASSTFNGTSIAGEVIVEIADIENRSILWSNIGGLYNIENIKIYIDPTQYGLNVKFVYNKKFRYDNNIDELKDNGIDIAHTDVIELYFDLPAYFVLLSDHDSTKNDSFACRGITTENEKYLYIKYAQKFYNSSIKLTIDCFENNYSDVSIYFRGIVSVLPAYISNNNLVLFEDVNLEHLIYCSVNLCEAPINFSKTKSLDYFVHGVTNLKDQNNIPVDRMYPIQIPKNKPIINTIVNSNTTTAVYDKYPVTSLLNGCCTFLFKCDKYFTDGTTSQDAYWLNCGIYWISEFVESFRRNPSIINDALSSNELELNVVLKNWDNNDFDSYVWYDAESS